MSSVPPQGSGAVPPPPPPPPPPYGTRPSVGLPWETQALGPEPFFETAKLFITSPVEAWRLTRETGDYMRPLLFGLIVGWVGAVFNAVWGSIFGAGILRMIPSQYQRFPMMGSGGGILFRVIFAPIAIALGLFIFAGILHVSFMIVGALKDSRSQFEGTFRLCSYASVSQIAHVIPIVGGLAAGVWGIYLIVVGAQQLHKTTQGKALVGVLLPVALCCVCAIIGMAIAGAAIFSAFRH
ncbi:MAG TPA: YIP1 family protein [Thermoanaerobaculia bacterium]|jgi:hypothetical protein|nr:YIP1 family protein [Thermoanaerobaculia bacterium]